MPPPKPVPLLLDPAPEPTVELPPGPDAVGELPAEPLVEPPMALPPGPEEEPIPGPSEKPPPFGEFGDEPLEPPTVCVGWPETIDEAAPNPPVPPPPGSPASGWPKNPLTVVFASPTWISRQFGFPVIGSSYFCRRKRMLFDFSS